MRQSDKSIKPSYRSRVADVDMTSMVDVTFLLLIFFMVTASFSLQKSVAMAQESTESSKNALELPPQSTVEVLVHEDGVFWIRCDAWNRYVVGKQALISSLKETLAKQKTEFKVRVSIVDQAKLQLLVDALDSIAAAGLAHVSVQQVSDVDLKMLATDSPALPR